MNYKLIKIYMYWNLYYFNFISTNNDLKKKYLSEKKIMLQCYKLIFIYLYTQNCITWSLLNLINLELIKIILKDE